MYNSRNIFVDMDNTIAIYDAAILNICSNLKIKIPEKLKTKYEISSFLKKDGKNNIWTKIQAYCYSYYIKDAVPAPHSKAVLGNLKSSGYNLYLVSHKTKSPAYPLEVDLQDFARHWVAKNFGSIFSELHFFEKKVEKVEFIKHHKPDYMIDDLPEILQLAQLGRDQSLLYSERKQTSKYFTNCTCWKEIERNVV